MRKRERMREGDQRSTVATTVPAEAAATAIVIQTTDMDRWFATIRCETMCWFCCFAVASSCGT